MNTTPSRTADDLDDAIDASFPASDPPSHSVPVAATLVEDARTTLYRVIEGTLQDCVLPMELKRYERRWASPTTGLIRMATSAPMAILDFLVAVEGATPDPLLMLCSHLCEEDIEKVEEYPEGWDALPYSESVRAIGDAWANGTASRMALRVPSAICRGECSILINTGHEKWKSVSQDLHEFHLDTRLRI